MHRPALALAALLAAPAAHAACGSAVLVSELLPDAAGTDAGQEWVELHNPSASPVDISGYVVERATQPSSWGAVFTVPAATTLDAGAFLVLAGPSTTLPGGIPVIRVTPGAELGNAGTSSDGVRLLDAAACMVDLVVYGSTNATDQVFVNEDGDDVTVAMLAPKPASGKALARVPDGLDTNDGTDFVLQDPTPGTTNVGSGPVDTDTDTDAGGGGGCVPGTDGLVVLNEFLPNPSGTDGGQEWIELFTASDEEVSVEGWTLQQAGKPSDWGTRVKYVFPPGATIAAEGFLLVAEEGAPVPERANVLTMPTGDLLGLGNSEDGLRLVDCDGTVIDEVVYGGSNPDGFLGEDDAPLADEEVAPAAREGRSHARRADGLDTGNHAADWAVEESPTPGGPNRVSVCNDTAGDVLVNEFLPDPDGSDASADAEWVELVHTGTKSVDISGWEILKLTSIGVSGPNLTSLVTIPQGTTLEPGELLVVGGLFAEDATIVVDGFDLGSGSGGDAVILRDCAGTTSDTVIYGGENGDGLLEDDGEEPLEGAGDPDEDQCVARVADGVDTNVSAADFKVTSRCTPGASNVLPADSDTDDGSDGAGGCACGSDGRPPRRTLDRNGGCSTVPGQGSAVVLLAVVAGVRRRRHGAAAAPR